MSWLGKLPGQRRSGQRRVRRERFSDFLERYGLRDLYEQCRKYLPSLPPAEEVDYVPFPKKGVPESVQAFVTWMDGRLAVSFRRVPPDRYTFLHEVIHLAGGGEIPAWNYVAMLDVALKENLPPFNLLDLEKLTLEDVEEVLREFGLNSVKDYFNAFGVIPVAIMDFDERKREFRLREGVPPGVIVQTFLAEVSGALDYGGWLETQIFKRLAEKLAQRRK